MTKSVINDMRCGLKHGRWKYLCALCAILIVFIHCTQGRMEYAEFLGNYAIPTIGDLFSSVFQGKMRIQHEFHESYQIPVDWLLLNLSLFLVVSNSVDGDIGKTGIQILLRSRSRTSWILCKYISAACNTFLFVLSVFAVCVISVLVSGGQIELNVGGYLNVLVLDANPGNYCVADIYLLPLFSLIAMVFILITIEIAFGSIVSYLTALAVCFLSDYFFTAFLPGNGSMLLRSTVLSVDGLSISLIYCVDLVFILVLVILGIIIFQRKDFT